MAEANLFKAPGENVDITPTAALTAGQVIQLLDGRAAVVPTAIAAGVLGIAQVDGIYDMAKTTSMVILKGSKLYWDASANKVHLLQVNDADFYVGTATEDATSSATTCKVALNCYQSNTLSLGQGFSSLPVSTAGFTKLSGMGDGVTMVFDVTAEAQKLDALSLRGIATGTPAIVESLVSINVNGDDAAFDLNIGLANGTHASDFDSVTEYMALHVDGASLNLNLQSTDGTTVVASADSTVDAVLLTPFLLQLDLRNWSDIQVYINGVNVLPSSVFKLNLATGPLKLIAHMEKGANDSPGNVTVMSLTARTFNAYDA